MSLLARLADLGLVKPGGRQRTDSTHVLARLRGLNRLELAGESVRAALEALAAAAPDWLSTVIDEAWAGVYGSRIDDLHLPESETKRTALGMAYGRDGYRLLDAAYARVRRNGCGSCPRCRPCPNWVQQYYRVIDAGGEKVIRREAEQGSAGQTEAVSPRHARPLQRETRQGTGRTQAHFTETCPPPAQDDPDTGRPSPEPDHHVATTAATVTAWR